MIFHPPDHDMRLIFGGVYALLIVVTIVALVLTRLAKGEAARARVQNLRARTWSFWLMSVIFTAALLTGEIGAVVLFGLVSLLALREFMTLAPTQPSDHRAMVWAFFVITPYQYFLVWVHWYGFYSILIPVYAFLFIPTINALTGDSQRFLERTATVQWGLMVCVYALSYAPALFLLRIPGYIGESPKLLLFCIVIVQLSDFLQYVFGHLFGRHKIAPRISPNKTWEGFIGGVGVATLVGTALWWATPFTPWEAFVMSLLITLMGFAGGLTMSAIKRDRGVKDFGSMISGHGGILDRVDSLCFAVPVFFHVTRYFFARGENV